MTAEELDRLSAQVGQATALTVLAIEARQGGPGHVGQQIDPDPHDPMQARLDAIYGELLAMQVLLARWQRG